MREAMSNLVHPILERGLQLKDRLSEGEMPDLLAEQAAMKDLLLTESEGQASIDFSGEGDTRSQSDSADHKTFLGARYALVCWLDETFTSDPHWGPLWNERKLESEMYGSNDRAWRFWEQAELSQLRPGTDAMEVFFWCVMLGFRGQKRSQPEQLHTWASASRMRLGNVHELSWPYAPGLPPTGNAAPLHGWQRLRQVILSGWMVLLLLLPMLAYFLVRNAGR